MCDLKYKLAVLFGLFLLASGQNVWAGADRIQEGKKLALEFCQACHHYKGTEQAGTVAPPLVGMKQRFPKKNQLFDLIYDPQKVLSKDTMMPPFGRNKLLAKEEIDKVIEFLYTL